MSYRADKVKFTDRETDRQTQASTIPLWPERPRGNKINLNLGAILAKGGCVCVIRLQKTPTDGHNSLCLLPYIWMDQYRCSTVFNTKFPQLLMNQS